MAKAIEQSKLPTSWLMMAAVFLVWDIYLFITMVSPVAQSSRLNLSDSAIALLRLSVALPYLLIWQAAIRAYLNLRKYAQAVGAGEEKQAFDLIAKGVLILLLALMGSALGGALRSYFVGHPSLISALTITVNYMSVLPYLAAFSLFAYGTTKLIQMAKLHVSKLRLLLYALALIVFTYFWLDLIFTNTSRQQAQLPATTASYYLRDSLIVLTIVIPAFTTWLIGLFTVEQLRHFYTQIGGKIYRRSLSTLVKGFYGVILASMLLQALLSLGGNRLLALGLGPLLGIIYLFIAIQGLGLWLISRGAKRLTKIETA